MIRPALLLVLLLFSHAIIHARQPDAGPWTADNGNGTFTNPLFYEEFSDPDLIRVGDDYYMTGTTMHAMPGLPVLHSRDLVNWELLTYASPVLDLGPAYRLQDGQNKYGQGIWAPCLRYHEGVFYIFTNVNRYGTLVFTATDPAGPWKRQKMNATLHDLSVLFDDDGKVYAVWDYNELKIAELTPDLMDIVPGTQQVVVPAGSGAGEGCHFYKIDGRYYITNTNYDPVCYQVCLRADNPYGPYEVNVMSAEENLGVGTGWRLWDTGGEPPYNLTAYPPNHVGCIPMHQGGIVQTQSGEWWGWSMLDHNSVGRVTALSPVTWKDGWPHFGLPGNLNRSPRTWVKPETGFTSEPKAPFEHDDDFAGPQLANAWQWNHVPDSSGWSLQEREGYLRLHPRAAPSFWEAPNTLTQRGLGPEAYALTLLDASGLRAGDVAGLGLLNLPYAWLGVRKEEKKLTLRFFDQQKQETLDQPLKQNKVWLRVHTDFDSDTAQFSYSLDGKRYEAIGGKIVMPYQLKTFQGVRYALFAYNETHTDGGHADFDRFSMIRPRPTRPIPLGKVVKLTSLADSTVLVNWRNHLRPVAKGSPFAAGDAALFRVIDRGRGRIALQSLASGGYVTVKGQAGMAEVRIEEEDRGEASTFQWQDMLRGDLMLMSLYSHRYLFADPHAGSLCSADAPGAQPDRKGGACFYYEVVE
ncbi:family 43 glycosylhydrolase [Roseivirga sp. BDSF3-8]|uniref:family 43 glycosylhydrolase n=1 Tax=Roseivirga sp. BDSF3-8 TaxID=3241598 RepID=UPI0035323BE8